MVEPAGVQHLVQRHTGHAGLDEFRIGVERPNDLARGIELFGLCRIDLVQNDDVGEFDLIDEQIDQRAVVLLAQRLAPVLEEIG